MPAMSMTYLTTLDDFIGGKKDLPPSPYTFDNPDMEMSIRRFMTGSAASGNKTPVWFDQANDKIRNHDGEALVFTENFLPSNKHDQGRPTFTPKKKQRPVSGISTKSAPTVVNGDTYYRPNKTHSYLQASKRPQTAKVDRETRASKLRNRHRQTSMSATPSCDTKLQLKRMKEQKPKPIHMNKDLIPIPSSLDETPHSFIIGARYNCSNFMDSRSFSRLGLYVPRQNPLKSFLKNSKQDMTQEMTSDFAGSTAVKPGGNSGSASILKHQNNKSSPVNLFIKKVAIKEAWLTTDNPPTKKKLNKSRVQSAQASSETSDSNRMTCNTPISRGGSSRRSSQSSDKVNNGTNNDEGKKLVVDPAIPLTKSTLISAVVPRPF